MKLIGYIAAVVLFLIAACLLLFGVLYILGSGSTTANAPSFGTGVLLFIFGVVCAAGGIAAVFFARQRAASDGTSNVTLNIDLPGKVGMDSLKCQSCGGVLTRDNIEVVNGAPMVTCPFCHTIYQLTEEPKW